MSKTYANARISVQFDASRCIHSENCVHGLPGVFDPQKRPWIDVEGASADELMRQIERCPSGALSYQLLQTIPTTEDTTMSSNRAPAVSIQVTPQGPLIVKGHVQLTDDTGLTVVKEGTTALCRCGASKNKPFCDGSHKSVGDIW